MRSLRTSLLLLPAGFTAGHAFGYLVAGDGHHASEAVGHGYLSLVVRLAAPLALSALAWAFARGIRARRCDLRWQPVALQQMALFLLVEAVEHGLAGYGPEHVLHAPTTLWGVVGQAGAAWLVVTAVRAAGAAGRRAAPDRRRRPVPAAPRPFPRPAPGAFVRRDAAATWAHLRAPPGPLAA